MTHSHIGYWTVRLRGGEGEIIAIGTLRKKISNDLMNIWWLPTEPPCVHEPGTTIEQVDEQFKYYFRQVRRWTFHAETSQSEGQVEEFQVSFIPIAKTRYDLPIAFRFLFSLQSDPLRKTGDVYWLPPTTEISDYEAVNLILKERYGLLLEQEKPEWVEQYKLPKQLPVEQTITVYEQKIQELEDKLNEARQDLEDVTRFHKMLYETGEDVLEPVVRDALRELKAEVEDPQVKGREDGRAVDPAGRNWMLEIKGPEGSLKLRDVRQLDQWVRDAIAEEEWEGKGLLIVNAYHKTPLEQRGDPFPDNCVKTARSFGLCLITTSQLFRALVVHQREELDVNDFWDTLFNTNGVCSLPDVLANGNGTKEEGDYK